MRSQLSTRLAEQRAHQLEAQLGEERKKREGIQRELNREKKRANNINKNRVMPSHHAKKKDTITITSSTPFVGSSLDDLPPFAAALAANAEREEMEKRRKLGLLVQEEEEEEDDDEYDEMKLLDLGFDVNDNEYALNLEVDNSIRTVPGRTDSLVTTQKQQQTESLEFNSSSLPMISSSDNKTTSLASSDTNFNLFSTINNNTINTINSQYTPQYINDDIQTLRQNCILLTHQRATLQQKLKASENSRKSLSNELKSSIASDHLFHKPDWTRRLSDTRKEMDAQKEQWKKDLRAERREWKNDRSALERQIQVLEVERDELTVLLENQKNITFVMGLFCELARECMVSSLRDGKERVVSTCCNSAARTWNMVRYNYSGKINRPNRMLTVGGAGGQTDGIRRRDAILIWVDEMFRRVKSWRQSICQHRNGDNSQLTPPTNTMTNQEVSTSTKERMPLLIRKNPRRSRLSQPHTVFKRRIRNVDSDLPDFMKG